MIQKIKNTALIISAALTFMISALVPAVASADAAINGNLCQGANLNTTTVNSNSGCTNNTSTKDFQQTLATIINIVSIVVGVVAVIMIIYGGFRYITSGGKQESVTNAKNTILYGLIGLIIVALAQLIVKFVLNQASTAAGSG